MTSIPEPALHRLRGGPTLRWGVLGPGEIANDFTQTLHANSDQRVVAVGSRDQRRAQAFADRHGIDRAHGSYEALVTDTDVDVVYVATPHPQHLSGALLAIDAGKHVLVEKPMTTSAHDTETLAAAARARGVFAMEALWTRYLPHTRAIDAVRDAGVLGATRLVTVDVGWPHAADPRDRMFDPAQGGGALLDAGVYGLWFAQWAIGTAVDVRAVGRSSAEDPAVASALGPTLVGGGGVDLQSVATLRNASSADAVVTTSMLAWTPGLPVIAGDRGTIRFTDHFVFPASFVVHAGGQETEWRDRTGLVGRQGLVWQAAALAQYVADGRTESPLHALDDSIALARTMDRVRGLVTSLP